MVSIKYNPRRKAVSYRRILTFLAVGFVLGLGIGYIFMGTTHAIMESRGAMHYGHTEDGGVEQQQQAAEQRGGSGGDSIAADAGAQQAVAATSTEAASEKQAAAVKKTKPKLLPDSIHTLCTSNGSPYQNYQLRIAYATYKLIQAMPGGERHVAFTRILHRTKPDAFMGEFETFRADPLQPKCDDWCEYPVSDRANAVHQFFDASANDPTMIRGEWIYMIESDYVFMKPLPLPDSASKAKYKAWAYPFNYINPSMHPAAMRKLYPDMYGPVSDIPGTGPAPMLMRAADWIKVTPDWEKYTAMIEADEEMKKELGWVREMYAFSVALAVNHMKTELKPPGQTQFISQLPIDHSLGNAHAFHYTQCTIYKTLDNKDVWAYDKRFHTAMEESLNVPAIEVPPKFEEGKWKFIEGNPVTQDVHEAIIQMVDQMNKGIATLKPVQA